MSPINQQVKRAEDDESSSVSHWSLSPAHAVLVFLAILIVAVVVALRPWLPDIYEFVKNTLSSKINQLHNKVNQLLEGVGSLVRLGNGGDTGRRDDIDLRVHRGSPVLRSEVARPPRSLTHDSRPNTIRNAQSGLPAVIVPIFSAGTELLESTAAPPFASGAGTPPIAVPQPMLHPAPPVYLVGDGRNWVQRMHMTRPISSSLF